MKRKEIELQLSKIINDYSNNLRTELKDLWNGFNIDLSVKEQYEVIAGIVARQITITIHFVSNSNIWTGDIAPIILRSLADNYINLAWILESPQDRAKKFILYGLGQEKLMIEHRKKQLLTDGQKPEEDELVQFSEKWINSQRYTFLTDVDLGSWSGLSTREMAQQANCIDFYNFVYQPFSSAVHNMWNHIARYNLITSENVLHKLLKTPIISDIVSHFDYLDLAAKYTEKCFFLYYKKFPCHHERKSSYDTMRQQLEELEKIISNKNGSA
jgi:hypothetical protein